MATGAQGLGAVVQIARRSHDGFRHGLFVGSGSG